MNFMMFNAWMRESADDESFASSSKKVRVVFNKTVSSDFFSTPFFLFQLLLEWIISGSALKIAIIVGGIPADLRRTVLCDSFDIRSKVRSRSYFGKCENYGTTSNRPTKISKVCAVISIAPLCLN